MTIEMSMQPEMQHQVAHEQLQAAIHRLDRDMTDLKKHVTGGGNPEQGLLWITADLVKLVGAMQRTFDLHVAAMDQRRQEEQRRRSESSWNWSRMGYDIVRYVLSILVLAALIAVATGGGIQVGPR